MQLSKFGLIAILTFMGFTNQTLAETYWNHNGSVMRLLSESDERVFVYDKPSQRMINAGVSSGDVLFEGQRRGNRYYGTARVFSKYCDSPLTYSVSGTVSPDQTKITMTGKREVFTSGCRATGKFTKDTLVFTYMSD